MLLYDNPDPRVATGRLFSTMMVTIIVLTTLALVSFGSLSSNHQVFSGRTPSAALVPAEQ